MLHDPKGNMHVSPPAWRAWHFLIMLGDMVLSYSDVVVMCKHGKVVNMLHLLSR